MFTRFFTSAMRPTPDVYPVLGVVGVASVLAVAFGVRKVYRDPTVCINKKRPYAYMKPIVPPRRKIAADKKNNTR